jgi:uncharacterized protein YbjT (DUF2867 family)
MEIVIAGGHGKIALLAERRLTDAGHHVHALIRNPTHADDVRDTGAKPLLADLEGLDATALATLIGPADAIVFAAGAGPGSGPERKWTVDLGAAVKLIEVAQTNGIGRYVMISAVGADPDAQDDGGFGTYLKAKGQADAALAASGLDFTTIRPVGLTDAAATGMVSTDPAAGSREIPRADVADAIVVTLATAATVGRQFVLREGEIALAEALADPLPG